MNSSVDFSSPMSAVWPITLSWVVSTFIALQYQSGTRCKKAQTPKTGSLQKCDISDFIMKLEMGHMTQKHTAMTLITIFYVFANQDESE